MGIEILSEWEIVYGSSTLLIVIFSWIIGIRIILKYFQYDQKILISVGVTWILLTSIWWKGAIIFLSIIFEINIEPFIFLALGNMIMTIGLLVWIHSFTTLVLKEFHDKILLIYSVIVAVYLGFFIIFLFIDTSLIGEYTGTFSTQTSIFVKVFQLFAMGSFLITGILFVKTSMESESDEIKWKGRFLLLAFVIFSIASFLEVFRIDDISILTLIFTKLLFLISSISYYFGFFLPKWLKDMLVKA